MKIIRFLTLGAILPAFLAGCPRDPRPPTPGPSPADAGPLPPPPPDDPDAATPATCAGWCSRASKLGCDAARPTPAGASCLDVCSNVQKSGVIVWNLGCMVRARTCAAADSCG